MTYLSNLHVLFGNQIGHIRVSEKVFGQILFASQTVFVSCSYALQYTAKYVCVALKSDCPPYAHSSP